MRNKERSRGPKKGLHFFTIVEMIWVLVVIMIISGMTVGVFQTLSTRKGAEGGARMVSRQLFLCRDYALLKRKRVALLIPQGTGGAPLIDGTFETMHGKVAATENGTKYGLAMRPCFVDSSNQFDGWVPNTKWEFVPDRVRLDVSSAGLTDVSGKFETTSGTDYDIPAIIFQPNGSLKDRATDITGIKVTNGSDQTHELEVNWLTGKAKFVNN